MTILDEIVLRTSEDLQKRRSLVRESELHELPLFDSVRRPFTESLAVDGLSVIAEIKVASPSKGIICAEHDVSQVARQYEGAGAAAISVLTEPHFFAGHLDNLGAARASCAVPLLRKDFVVDTYQIVEARAYGADAVLLIATVLGRAQLSELLHACDELGLGHLVELYETSDLNKVDFDRVGVIGVNSRDLHTFEVDLDRAGAIFREIPDGIVRVAESGISVAQDVERVAAFDVDAILVGELLMRADNPGDALRELVAVAKVADSRPTSPGSR